MSAFLAPASAAAGRTINDYAALYDWSVKEPAQFWECLREFVGFRFSRPADAVVDDVRRMPGARWFPGARLNFAENLLRRDDGQPAILFFGEDQVRLSWSFRDLSRHAAGFGAALRTRGLVPGDRVAALMPNMPETVAAMLGATASGMVFSSCSPDFGVQGVLDRFGQIEPRVLVAADAYYFKGRRVDCTDKIQAVLNELPSVEHVVIVSYANDGAAAFTDPRMVSYEDFLEKDAPAHFEQLPFDHPVYIMYSSGTTGLPKCMVQGPGVLLNHLKELRLHTDVGAGDRIFYFTTCGWMMWNWLVSALGLGATIVLFDGNPLHPDPGVLWRLAEETRLNVFGTSARYLGALEQAGYRPREKNDLSNLRTLLSTGSPLPAEGFAYVYRDVKADLQLSSISGGTDLNGCFALGNPLLPVRAGQLQCRGLGMKVEIYDETGHPVRGQQGELVCEAAFPSMPLYFWDDPDGRKYHDAYFDMFPGVWRHGDFAEITEHDGLIVYGRSDATLNPGGVRIGTADIYRVVESFPEIEDSVVIGQKWQDDVRVVLFVKMKSGAELTDELRGQVCSSIRTQISPRHVPAKIISVQDIPYTRNMKKVELAVRRVVEGQPVSNREALANPGSLEYFAGLSELDT